ncbi:hypothetical protein L798_00527 [Zootermopsis nevadensis]|uniref:Uncharacterized protein n=1 Tax=Zootermopsis nevadensis TaxID=136037 RepID=A0A067QXS0_ZOONE|nr:hypothetical protein L798_00527 [Zootermopsis nevadensis]
MSTTNKSQLHDRSANPLDHLEGIYDIFQVSNAHKCCHDNKYQMALEDKCLTPRGSVKNLRMLRWPRKLILFLRKQIASHCLFLAFKLGRHATTNLRDCHPNYCL